MCSDHNSWLCLKECAPEKDGRYLCYDGYEVNIAWYSVKHGMFFDGDGAAVFVPLKNVIDWMALPKPRGQQNE